MSTDERPRISVRLRGGAHPDGEVPLDDLAEIGRHLQQLVRRLDRQLSDRAGAGRPPDELSRRTALLLVGLGDGSTTLELAGAPPDAQLQLDVGQHVENAAFDALVEALQAVAQPIPSPPPNASPPVVESLRGLVGALRPYPAVYVLVTRRDLTDQVELQPPVVAVAWAGNRDVEQDDVAETARQVAGRLYALNLHTGRFLIEDALGNTIDLAVPAELRADALRLVDSVVVANGGGVPGASGRLLLQVTAIETAEPIGLSEDAAFRQSADLDVLLADAVALRSLAELALPELTEDEGAAFLAALA